MIDFTGNISDSTIKQIQACQIKKFYQVKIKTLLEKPENKLVAKKVFKDNDLKERERKILKVVKSCSKKNHSCIDIDEYL